MSKVPGFFHLEGHLYESVEFDYRRGYESATSPRSLDETNELGFRAVLIDSEGRELLAGVPKVRFPTGCSPRRPNVGISELLFSLPQHADARALELRLGERTILRKPIATEAPTKLEVTDIEVAGDRLSFRLSGKRGDDSEIQVFLRVMGRRLPLTVAVTETAVADLTPYAGLGEAQLVVAHSAGFRTTESESGPFALPRSRACGRILAPRNGTEVAAGAALSLIGTVYCRSGRTLDWETCRARWRIDGKPIDDARPISSSGPLSQGKHAIELVVDERGEAIVAHSVTIRVKEKTEAQVEYDRLLEEYLSSKSSETTLLPHSSGQR